MQQLTIIKQITNRESLSLELYLHDVGKIRLITSEEEVNLTRRIHKGDLNARDCLINANLRFVVSVSKQYQNRGMSLPDLINEGNLGLIEAAQRFDDTRGLKFISYAVWWIRQSIILALSNQVRVVRLPINLISSISKVKKTLAKLEQKYEREPTALEISQASDLAPAEVEETLKHTCWNISLDAPVVQGEEENMYDILSTEEASSPDKGLLKNSLSKEIERILNTLTPKEADIIQLFFGLNENHVCTLEEIGEKFNITRERVRQIKEKAIRRLRYSTRSKVSIRRSTSLFSCRG